MYSTSQPTSIRIFHGRPSPSTTSTRADTPAAFPGVHFTSNWSAASPPDSATSFRIRALSCHDTSDRHRTVSDFAAPIENRDVHENFRSSGTSCSASISDTHSDTGQSMSVPILRKITS